MPISPALGRLKQEDFYKSKLAWTIYFIPGQPGLQNESLSQKPNTSKIILAELTMTKSFHLKLFCNGKKYVYFFFRLFQKLEVSNINTGEYKPHLSCLQKTWERFLDTNSKRATKAPLLNHEMLNS